jgi:hypothetical protein
MGAKIPKKRRKKSGIVYFAVNNRLEGMVKIGMTIDTANARLKSANKRNEFMPGTWEINQKVKTKNAKQTEELAHQLFAEEHDHESVSEEMYFIKEGVSVKEMADFNRALAVSMVMPILTIPSNLLFTAK